MGRSGGWSRCWNASSGNPRPHPARHPASPPAPTFDQTGLEGVSESTWESWCDLVRSHRLGRENLGRFVARLGDLPQGLWHVPLDEYAGRSLAEIRSTPGHGPARTGQVAGAFARVAESLAGCRGDAPLALRLMPPYVRDASAWAEGVLRGGTVPAAPEIRAEFLTPLIACLESDLGEEAAGVVRRRIGFDGPAETLEEVAQRLGGVTRERVRQIAVRAGAALQARWAEGRCLLEALHNHFRQSAGSGGQLDLMRATLDTCFALEVGRESREDVLAAWDRAGRAKRTPLGGSAVRAWAAEEYPGLPADAVCRWLAEEGLGRDGPGGETFYSRDAMDRLLLHLNDTREPLASSGLQAILGGDERSSRMRVERDPRFVEDEFKRVSPAEWCSFFRRDGRWYLRPDPAPGGRTSEAVGASDLAFLVVGGLVQAGICDATVWGVHRFANSVLALVFGATLPAAVTPFVLASTLVRHSEGAVRHMRRRRLRWDSADGSIPVRGKRGWIDHLTSRAGVPMTYEELDTTLRGSFQDYASFVLKQLHLADDEEGETEPGYQYVPGVAKVVPGILVPRGWQPDPHAANVSPGVRQVAAKIAALSARSPFPKAHLAAVPWMARLCEHLAPDAMRWEECASPPDGVPTTRRPGGPAATLFDDLPPEGP